MSNALKVVPSDSPTSSLSQVDKPWYKDGLRFKCTECGGCCTGSPGYTWITEEEARKIAAHLNLSFEEFSWDYLRQAGNRLALKEHAVSYDCVLLDGKRCSVYNLRPKQCRTFPWWPENVESPEAWEEASRHCEGINDEADLIPCSQIETQLSSP